MEEYIRKCPQCDSIIEYRDKYTLKTAILKNGLCKSCTSSNRNRTKEWNDKISTSQKGIPKWSTEDKIRISNERKDYFKENSVWNKGLTKETDIRILSVAETLSNLYLGKSYEEIHGIEKAKKIKNKQSKAQINHPKYIIIREQFKNGNRIQHNKGIEMSDSLREIYKVAVWENIDRNNKIRNKIIKRSGYDSFEEWYNSKDLREQYYYEVIKLTRKNVHLVKGFDKTKRGIAGKKNAYQIDHIYPISLGFKNNIAPEILASVDNLRFIPWKENLSKSNKYA